MSVLVHRCPAPRLPPVVLVHGTGADARTWDAAVAGLVPDRDVHAVDLRGHGASGRTDVYSVATMAADLAALLRSVPGPADVVGHSLGGLVALRAAVAGPDRVRRVVLEDVGLLHPRPSDPPPRPDYDPGFDWRVVEQVRPEVDSPAADWPEVLAAVTQPLLVVAGGPLSFVRAEHVEELAAIVPDGRVVTLGTGHEVHLGAPGAFLDAVRSFLDPAPARRTT
ncbi:alpha/beta fold hydrolase [Phycicoccus sp. CMS6Z-2]|nr:alpha/beta fold hydrolase [Phycicoccus flavus]